MLKQIFKALLLVAFTSTAFAQEDGNTLSMERPKRDQFATYVIKGYSLALEYASMQADVQVKVYSDSDALFGDYTARGNTNSPAGALGVSVSYGELRRDSTGWIAGGTLVHKVENEADKTKNSLRAADSITQLRPEGNLAYALNNGLYGMVGGHVSILSGEDINDVISPVGFGVQAAIGFVPTRNFGIDIGYYVSHHYFSDKYINDAEQAGIYVKKYDSWVNLNQARIKTTYYF